MHRFSIALVTGLFSISILATADQYRDIVHDPFSYANKPIIEKTRVERTASPGSSEDQPTVWSPKLLATIVAGSRSMANVEGTVVRIGEKVDGYELLAVNGTTATFGKSNNRYILKLALQSKTR